MSEYLISYYCLSSNKKGGQVPGFGRCVLTTKTPIDSGERIEEIEEEIKRTNGVDSVAILFIYELKPPGGIVKC